MNIAATVSSPSLEELYSDLALLRDLAHGEDLTSPVVRDLFDAIDATEEAIASLEAELASDANATWDAFLAGSLTAPGVRGDLPTLPSVADYTTETFLRLNKESNCVEDHLLDIDDAREARDAVSVLMDDVLTALAILEASGKGDSPLAGFLRAALRKVTGEGA